MPVNLRPEIAALTPTRMCVRKPACFPKVSRSQPKIPDKTAATTSLKRIAKSSFMDRVQANAAHSAPPSGRFPE